MRRKVKSLWMLMTRMTVYKILLVFFAVAALEVGLLLPQLHTGIDTGTNFYPYNLNQMVQNGHINWVFRLGLVAVVEILVQMQGRGSAYTMERLGLRRWQIHLHYALHNAVWIFLYYMVQALVGLGLAAIYYSVQEPQYLHPQIWYLIFYRVPLLYNAFPMEDYYHWILNLLVFLGLGVCAADSGRLLRMGRRPFLAVVVAVAVAACCLYELWNSEVQLFLFVVASMSLAWGGFKLFILDKEEREEAENHETT